MSLTDTLVGRSGAALLGQVVDRIAGEPPDLVHPLVFVGRGLVRLEQVTYRDRRLAGAVHLAIAAGGAMAVGLVVQRTTPRWLATTVTVAIASSSKMLGDVALGIGDELEAGDLDAARTQLRSLVGRRTDELSEHGIARAVIESVAENTVDGVTATWFWAVVGGAPMVCVHRVVNTLDAMVGHRTPRYARFGWASAKLDDVLNWVPARLTAVAIAATTPRRVVEVLQVVHRDGGSHPSPNGGRVEAAVAASLGITLGGSNAYGDVVEVRGALGHGRPPKPSDIRRAVHTTRASSTMLAIAGVISASWIRRGFVEV
jgi:adenosylcobinamide-phosphate synthase